MMFNSMSEVTVNLRNGNREEHFLLNEDAPLEISISPSTTPTRHKVRSKMHSDFRHGAPFSPQEAADKLDMKAEVDRLTKEVSELKKQLSDVMSRLAKLEKDSSCEKVMTYISDECPFLMLH